MLYGPACDLSWRMFCVHLSRMCILLLSDGMFCKYQLSLSSIMCHLRLLFINFLSGWSLHWCNWGVKVTHYYCVAVDFPFYSHYHLPYILGCSYVVYIYIYNCYIYFFDWSLDHYVVSFLVSCNCLYFKVYFGWGEYCYSRFLLISICMEYLFPSPLFQSVCVPRSEVDLF